VASQRAKRKQRQRNAAPRAVPSERRNQDAERVAQRRSGERLLGTVGERPPGPFGDLPVSELLIFIGAIGAVVGYFTGGVPAMLVGLAVVALGVIEVTAREHFSGFRSHTTLLAGIPAVGVGVAVIAIVGSRTTRELLLFVVALVFGGLFWLFRRSFLIARQRRVARR
jgi:hypothetical protein